MFPNAVANEIDRWLRTRDILAPVQGIASGSILHGQGDKAPNVFFVSSVNGSANNDGRDPRLPLATIDAAVGKCTASRGDLIIVMPLHVETVTAAGGLDLDVAGITIIGLGEGDDRAVVNFTTAVGADMDVDAASIKVINLVFKGGIDALTGPIDVNSAYFTMIDCETRDVTGQATDFIVTDANADDMKLIRWTHKGATAAGADTAITIVGGDNIIIEDANIDGNFAVGCIENVTTAAVNIKIYGGAQRPCYLRTRNAADIAIQLVATTTGDIGPDIFIRLQDNAANITECITIVNTVQIFDPIMVCNLDAERGMQYNGTASTDA